MSENQERRFRSGVVWGFRHCPAGWQPQEGLPRATKNTDRFSVTRWKRRERSSDGRWRPRGRLAVSCGGGVAPVQPRWWKKPQNACELGCPPPPLPPALPLGRWPGATSGWPSWCWAGTSSYSCHFFPWSAILWVQTLLPLVRFIYELSINLRFSPFSV